MTKRTVFTTISPLPPGVSREVVFDFLYNHVDMIDLNPLVVERHPIEAPPDADPYEKDCSWYSLTDRIDYLRGGKVSGNVSYTCAFHDLPNGIQTHCRAPLGVDICDKWTLNGTLPDEPPEPVEIGLGAPASGLYIREDVDLRCNILMASFVKKNLKRSHAMLVNKLVEKARFASAEMEVGGAGRTSHMWSPPSYLPHDAYGTFNFSPDDQQEQIIRPIGIPEDDSSSVEDDQPGRMAPVRLTTPCQASRPYTPPSSHDFPDPQPQPQSRSQAEFLLQCPPILRVPIQAPPPPPPTRTAPAAPTRTAPAPPTRAAPPPPTRTAPPPPPSPGKTAPPSSLPPSLPPSPPPSPSPLTPTTRAGPPSPRYPARLRIHDHPTQQQQQQQQQQQYHHHHHHHHQQDAGAWWGQDDDDTDDDDDDNSYSPGASAPSSPRLSPATTTPTTTRSSSEYEHPEYPHLSPYSSASISGGHDRDDDDDDEPLPPRKTPAFMWKGQDFAATAGPPGEAVAVAVVEHPACLRPGGLSCRLDRPFIAELEC